MIRISRFAILTAMLAVAACGGSGSADKTRPNDDSGAGQSATAGLPGREGNQGAAGSTLRAADVLQLSAVRLSTDNFYANVDLSAEVEVKPPVPDGIAFEYRWYVNNQLVADAADATLKCENYRKHQWIICEARAIAGARTSPWLKSNWVRAADSPPRIEPVPVGAFTIPGRFTYQIKASDADNDELTYELLAPLDMGIELDKKTGLLAWDLDNALVEKLGESIELSLSVSDNDLPPATGSITLRFQKRVEKKIP
jgi:hypothetical protein